MLWIIIGIFISYLIGSIPTAYIMGRALKGIDIRNFGSGNVGATNAWRVLGKGPGIIVLALDTFKGFIPVVFLGNILAAKISIMPVELLRIIFGISCIAGHNWTIFLKFKGGKGIATTLGVLLGLSVGMPGLRAIMGLVILTWVIVFVIARTISAASVIAAIALPIYVAFFKQPKYLFFLSLILSVFAVLRHKSNIVRILQGKEPRLNFRKSH